MNIALQNVNGADFYIAALKKDGDDFIAFGKRVSRDGRLMSVGQEFRFQNRRMAEAKIRELVKTKIKRRGWVPVNMENLPEKVVRYLEVPPEMRVTPEEMVLILRDAQAERYVIFSDVSGLEEFFDVGIEYLGFEVDEHIIKVFDRFGSLRDCFVHRMKAVQLTERAVEANSDKMILVSKELVKKA